MCIAKKLIVTLLIVLIVMSGCSTPQPEPQSEPEIVVQEAADLLDLAEEEPLDDPEGDYAEEIAAMGTIMFGEYPKEGRTITIQDGMLTISSDISDLEPSTVTLEEYAESEAWIIAWSVLSEERFDELWETVTIEYVGMGSYSFTENHIVDTDYGRAVGIPEGVFSK